MPFALAPMGGARSPFCQPRSRVTHFAPAGSAEPSGNHGSLLCPRRPRDSYRSAPELAELESGDFNPGVEGKRELR